MAINQDRSLSFARTLRLRAFHVSRYNTMILDRTLSIAVALVALSLLPQGIAIYQFAVSGDLDCPMSWRNETNVWSAAFSIFALTGVALAYRARSKGTKAYAAILLLGLLVASFELYPVIQGPNGPASKVDDAELHLLEFWAAVGGDRL